MLNIVLVSPQIPQNTGAIGRLCVNIDATLHIIKPIMFEISDKSVKKAGLDYWNKLDIHVWDSLKDFLEAKEKYIDRFFFATTKTKQLVYDVKFKKDDYILFGGESTGLPMELMQKKWENTITLPMGKNGRSLNLAMSVGTVAYKVIGDIYETSASLPFFTK